MTKPKIAGLTIDPLKASRPKHKHRPIVAALVEDYLAEHRGLTVADGDAELLARLVTTPPRDRSGSFSGSARGSCERAQVFQYLNAPQRDGKVNTTLQSVFLDGTWRHLRWQMLLLAAGRHYDVPVEVEVPFRDDDLRLRGSVDGIVDGRGFELKGTRMMHAALKAPFASHVLQVHSYMVLADLDIFSVVYEDKATQETVEHVVVRDPKTEKKVRDELARLNEAVDQQVLPPILPGCQADTKSQAWWDCAYRDICAGCDYASAEAAGRR